MIAFTVGWFCGIAVALVASELLFESASDTWSAPAIQRNFNHFDVVRKDQ